MSDCGLIIYLFIFQKSEMSWRSRSHFFRGPVMVAFLIEIDGC